MVINIARNFSSLMVSQIGYKLLSFISIAYIARQIGVIKFGQFSFALYLGLLFFALADMGLSEVYICETAGKREVERKMMGVSIGSKIILSLLTFLLLIVCAFLLVREPNLIILILLVGVAMILDSFTYFLRSVFRAREKMRYEAVSFMLEGLIKFALLIVAVTIFKTNLLPLGVALLATSIIALLVAMLFCKNKLFLVSPVINKRLFLKLFKRGLPFAIIGFLSIVSLKIDIIMLSKMVNDSVTGWYSAAVKLVESILVIPVTLSIVLFPVIVRLYKNSSKSFFSMYRVSLIGCIIAGMSITYLLYAGANFFVIFIFGERFINSVYAVRILSLTMIPYFLKFFLERTALVLGKVDVLVKVYIGGVAIKIILNFLFIPIMNYESVAFATVFTEILIVVYILFEIKKHFDSGGVGSLPESFASRVLFLHEER